MVLQTLMLKDISVMNFDLDDYYIEVLNNDVLPFALRDCITTTADNMHKNFTDMIKFRDWLSSRVLNLSRTNAKVILNVAALPQTLRTEDRIKICLVCKGLSMSDSYWIREHSDETFSSVNLRKQTLCDASYQIAILGKHISATREELRSDLNVSGMFSKFWKRSDFLVELWKTDNTTDFINTNVEIEISKLLDKSNVNHVCYWKETKDGKDFAVCECLSNEQRSMVTATELKDWCSHTKKDFLNWVIKEYNDDFKKMCLVDYVFANTDRHFENFGFWMNNETGSLEGMLPLYDHNQALIADYMETCIDELIYEPLGCVFQQIPEFCRDVDLYIDVSDASDKVQKRYNSLII